MFSIIKETCKNTKGCKCCYELPFNLYKNIDSKIPKVSKVPKVSSTHNINAQIQPSNNNYERYIKKIKPFYMID